MNNNCENNVIVIRADYAKQLLQKNHVIVDLMPKRFKNSTNVDLTRCIFCFKYDETIKKDLEELKLKTENNKSKSL